MVEVRDPAALAQARAQRNRFDLNAAWLQAHAAQVYAENRGRCICIAGEEVFVADTPEEAVRAARAKYPHDDGWFVRYIPREKVSRVYAHRR